VIRRADRGTAQGEIAVSEGKQFNHEHLDKAKFHGCRLVQAEFDNVDMSQSKFNGVNLRDSSFTDINFQGQSSPTSVSPMLVSKTQKSMA
jgi:uncharacterized protein YjbI with pentapeptide repeats